MRKLVAGLLLSLAVCQVHAQTGSPKSVSALTTETNNLLPSLTPGNPNSPITAFNTRQVILDMVNSYPNSSQCATNTQGCFTIGATSDMGPSVGTSFWDIATAQFGFTLSSPTLDQFGILSQVLVPTTGSTTAYEKVAVEGLCLINDPVNPALPGVERGCVGVESRGYIGQSNTLGQAWGGLDWAEIVPGSGADGLLIGREIDIYNFGTDQPLMNTLTTKGGLEIVSAGTNPATYGLFFIAAPQRFHKVIFADPSAIVPLASDPNSAFIDLNTVWTVKVDGSQNQQGNIYVQKLNGVSAGGATPGPVMFSSVSGFGIYYGSGAPTITAAQGSIYLNTSGSSTSTRVYVNKDGTANWTNLVSGT